MSSQPPGPSREEQEVDPLSSWEKSAANPLDIGGQTPGPLSQEKEIDLLPSWKKIVANRGRVAAIVALCMIGFAAWTYFVPPVYQAKMSIIVPAKASRDSGFASSLGIAVQAGSPTGMIESVLKSERTLAAVANEVGLTKRKLRGMIAVTRDRGYDVVRVDVEDKDQNRALRIAGAFVVSLEALFEDLNVPSKSEDAAALKTALDQRAAELATADEVLKEFDSEALTDVAATETFRSQLRIFEVELEAVESGLADVRGKIEQSADVAMDRPTDLPPAEVWRDKLIDLEYQLAVARQTYGDKHPEVTNLQAQVGQAEKTMESEIAAYLKSVQEGNLDPTRVQGDSEQGSRIVGLEAQRVALQAKVEAMKIIVDKIPEEQKRRQGLVRKISMLEEVVSGLTVQYEQARINETVDPNRWEVLDAPHLADKPVNKSYSKSLVLGLMLGLVLGSLYAVRQPA